jgi:hypothetical protein
VGYDCHRQKGKAHKDNGTKEQNGKLQAKSCTITEKPLMKEFEVNLQCTGDSLGQTAHGLIGHIEEAVELPESPECAVGEPIHADAVKKQGCFGESDIKPEALRM